MSLMRTFLKTLLLLSVIAAASRANAESPAASAREPTLAAALATVRRPDTGVALAIDADQISLPRGAAAPVPHDSLGNVADTFGRLLRQFGAVTAIAPPTMVVLNTNPRTPDILSGMASSDALKLLLASLSDPQWHLLASLDGLPLSSLQDDSQRALVRALFQNRGLPVNVGPYSSSPNAAPPEPRVIPPAEIMQGRLRLTRRIQILFSVVGERYKTGSDMPTKPDGSRLYEPELFPAAAAGLAPGEPIGEESAPVSLREERPNRPKPGDLNLKDRRFRNSIPLAGLKTAGDLIGRIAQMTRTEIYIDRRIESKPLTLTGAASAPAGDLLSALAFCLTGTYREVGPAFVLTDDRIGIGTRHQILVEFEQSIKRQRSRLLSQARKVAPRRSVGELPLRPDSVSLTPAQIQAAAKQDSESNAGEGVRVTVPLAQMTPEQQSAALKGMKDLVKIPGNGVDPNGPIELWEEPSLQLIVPVLDGPINLGVYTKVVNVFDRMPSLPDHEDPATAGDLLKLIGRYSHRPALVTPGASADVQSIVTSMRQLGLNEMWIVIFGPQVPEKSDSKALDGDDLLSDALKYTKNTGIVVLPVLDLFSWRPDSARASEDLNILGENSLELEARTEPIRNDRTGEPLETPESGLRVSPFDPAVQLALTTLIHRVAANPGIAGIVWENPNPFGYDASQTLDSDPSNTGFEMGYTVAARLAFLRQAHVDPVDLRPSATSKFDTSLPEFDNPALEPVLAAKWGAFRADEDEALMKRLLEVARTARPPGTPAPPILLGAHSTYYFTWDNLVMPLRTQTPLTGSTFGAMFRQIKAHSRDVMSAIGFSWWRHAELFWDYSKSIIGDSPWNGVVLDCDPTGTLAVELDGGSTQTPGQSSASILAQLAAAGPSGVPAPQKPSTP